MNKSNKILCNNELYQLTLLVLEQTCPYYLYFEEEILDSSEEEAAASVAWAATFSLGQFFLLDQKYLYYLLYQHEQAEIVSQLYDFKNLNILFSA